MFKENPYDHEDFIIGVPCPFEICPCNMNQWAPKFLDSKEAMDFIEISRRKQTRLLEKIRLLKSAMKV